MTPQTPDTDLSTPPVLVLLRRQAALFAQLDKLSERQSSAVSGGAADELLTILSTRQRFANELSDVQEQLQPFRDDWSNVRSGMTPPSALEAEQMLVRSSELLERILGRDDRDSAILEEAQGRIGAELTRINSLSTARAAYGGGGESDASLFTNREG